LLQDSTARVTIHGGYLCKPGWSGQSRRAANHHCRHHM